MVIDLAGNGLTRASTQPPTWLELLATYRWLLLVPVGPPAILFWIGVYRGVGQPPRRPCVGNDSLSGSHV